MTKLEREIAEIDAVVLSAEEEARIDEAIRTAHDPDDQEVALAASFDPHHRVLLVELKTGQRLAIPQEDLQDISDADPADLVEVEILGPGTALHFERVMEAVSVDHLRRDVYGSERWMSGLAQRRRERLQKAS